MAVNLPVCLVSILPYDVTADDLTDCEDPECCSSPACRDNQLCYTVPRPISILLQRQPPAPTASFFQKMR